MMSRSAILALVSCLALLNAPTCAWATPSVASRARTTPQRKPFPASPLFMSSSAASTSDDGASAGTENKLFAKIRQVSNVASFLCVLDCTLLPIITVILPLLGILNLGPSQMEFLHMLGHKLALFFVLPVGGLTGVINYLSHKKSWIASMAAVGLTLVGFANSHIHDLPFFGHVELLHMIQHGPWHRVTNILGCGLLLGSNYLSQKQGCAFDDGCSSHDHDHSHSHSHGSHGKAEPGKTYFNPEANKSK